MPIWRERDTLRARQLRREATPAERHLWRHISNRQLAGYRFNRQMQVGPFYCDFLCRQERLAVELDGFSHDIQPGRDKWRDRILAELNVRVLHFDNEDVFRHTEGVLILIGQALRDRPSPNPSRKREGSA